MKSRFINILKRNFKWIILFILLFLFIIIIRLTLTDKIATLDDKFYNLVKNYITPNTTNYIKLITKLGNALTVLIISLAIFIYKRKYGILIILNVMLTSIINFIFKNIFARQRPTILPLIIERGYSFPSGHSMVSISLYGYLLYLTLSKVKNRFVKVVVSLLLIVIILMIGLSRIYLGVHYISDVLAGYFLAVAFLIIFIHISKKFVDY